MSMFTVGSFTALWLIANELEDPFGPDPNDMPMLQFHQACVGTCGAPHTPCSHLLRAPLFTRLLTPLLPLFTPSVHTFCSHLLFTPPVHTSCSHLLSTPPVHTLCVHTRRDAKLRTMSEDLAKMMQSSVESELRCEHTV